jgi:hypothetical protein
MSPGVETNGVQDIDLLAHGARIQTSAFLISREDHRHCLGMDRSDDSVWRFCQKSIDLMRSWHWL